jgi:hypothetical protein
VHRVAGVEQLRGLLRDAGEQRVDGADEQVGAVAAGDARERGGHPGDGVAAHREEDHARERHQDDVAGLARGVRHHAGEDDRHGQQPRRRAQHQRADAGAQQSALLSDADAEHRDQHGAERREVDEVANQVLDDHAQPVAVEQADGFDQPVRAAPARALGPRVRHAPPQRAGEAAEQQHADGEDREERDRVRQQVAEPLDEAQEAREEPAATRPLGRRRWRGGRRRCLERGDVRFLGGGVVVHGR